MKLSSVYLLKYYKKIDLMNNKRTSWQAYTSSIFDLVLQLYLSLPRTPKYITFTMCYSAYEYPGTYANTDIAYVNKFLAACSLRIKHSASSRRASRDRPCSVVRRQQVFPTERLQRCTYCMDCASMENVFCEHARSSLILAMCSLSFGFFSTWVNHLCTNALVLALL